MGRTDLFPRSVVKPALKVSWAGTLTYSAVASTRRLVDGQIELQHVLAIAKS